MDHLTPLTGADGGSPQRCTLIAHIVYSFWSIASAACRRRSSFRAYSSYSNRELMSNVAPSFFLPAIGPVSSLFESLNADLPATAPLRKGRAAEAGTMSNRVLPQSRLPDSAFAMRGVC